MIMFNVQTAGEFFKLFAFYNEIFCVKIFKVFKDVFKLVSIILFFFAIICHLKKYILLLFNPENGIQPARKKLKRNVMRHLTTNLSGNSHLHNIYYNFFKKTVLSQSHVSQYWSGLCLYYVR